MDFNHGEKRHFTQNQGAKTRDQEIADRGFMREEGGAFVVEPTEDLKGEGTHMDKPLVTDLSDPKRDEPLQTGGQFVGDRDSEIAHRGFDRKAGGAFQDEAKDDLHGKGTHMDKPLVTDLSDPKRDEPIQTGGEFIGGTREEEIAHRGFDRKTGGAFKEEPVDDLHGKGTKLDKPLVNDPAKATEEPLQTGSEFVGNREEEIAHRGFDRKTGGDFKDEPREDLQGKGTNMDKPLVSGNEERKEGVAPQKELLTKASKHVKEEENPGEKIRERFERTSEQVEAAENWVDKPLVTGYGNLPQESINKDELTKISHHMKEELNPGEKIRERFERTLEKVEEAHLEGKKDDLKEFVTKASKHVEENINPGEKIRERFERTMEKVSEADRAKLAEKLLIEKQNMDAGLNEKEIQHYLDKKEGRI